MAAPPRKAVVQTRCYRCGWPWPFGTPKCKCGSIAFIRGPGIPKTFDLIGRAERQAAELERERMADAMAIRQVLMSAAPTAGKVYRPGPGRNR